MSYYDITYKGVQCRFEIGGDWNKRFRADSSHKECAQAVIPVWTVCDRFMRYLKDLPGTRCCVVDRSLRVVVDKKTVVATFVSSSRLDGFWLSYADKSLVYTRANSQPTFIKASSSQWVAWFMDHHTDLGSALLESDTDEDSLDKIPDYPRYLIRVGRKEMEIGDGEMDQITIKEVL